MSATLPRPGVEYVRLHPADLAYYLLEGPAPRDAVQVLRERRVALEGGQLTLAILGSSHFLEVRVGNRWLCELLACRRPDLDPARLRRTHRGSRDWAHRLQLGALEYDFELWRRDCAPAEFEAECSRLSTPSPRRLGYTFPGEEGSAGGITCLEWSVEGGRATVTTYHTFPGEAALVQSRTTIQARGNGASA